MSAQAIEKALVAVRRLDPPRELEEANAGFEKLIAALVLKGLTPEQAKAVIAKGFAAKAKMTKTGRGEARKKIAAEVKRLPDGQFAPKGMGQVLQPGQAISVPGEKGSKPAVVAAVGNQTVDGEPMGHNEIQIAHKDGSYEKMALKSGTANLKDKPASPGAMPDKPKSPGTGKAKSDYTPEQLAIGKKGAESKAKMEAALLDLPVTGATASDKAAAEWLDANPEALGKSRSQGTHADVQALDHLHWKHVNSFGDLTPEDYAKAKELEDKLGVSEKQRLKPKSRSSSKPGGPKGISDFPSQYGGPKELASNDKVQAAAAKQKAAEDATKGGPSTAADLTPKQANTVADALSDELKQVGTASYVRDRHSTVDLNDLKGKLEAHQAESGPTPKVTAALEALGGQPSGKTPKSSSPAKAAFDKAKAAGADKAELAKLAKAVRQEKLKGSSKSAKPKKSAKETPNKPSGPDSGIRVEQQDNGFVVIGANGKVVAGPYDDKAHATKLATQFKKNGSTKADDEANLKSLEVASVAALNTIANAPGSSAAAKKKAKAVLAEKGIDPEKSKKGAAKAAAKKNQGGASSSDTLDTLKKSVDAAKKGELPSQKSKPGGDTQVADLVSKVPGAPPSPSKGKEAAAPSSPSSPEANALKAYEDAGGDDPAILDLLKNKAEMAAEMDVPAETSAPTAPKTAAPAAPDAAAGDGGLQPNTGAVGIKDMVPGQKLEMLDGTQWTYHKPVNKPFHIMKPVDGGKAKPIHEEYAPPKIGPAPPGGADTGAVSDAPPAASSQDLYDTLKKSVDTAKHSGGKSGPIGNTIKAHVAAQNEGITSPGRGPSGKMRNFKAMNPKKLAAVIAELQDHGGDAEALDRAQAALAAKG